MPTDKYEVEHDALRSYGVYVQPSVHSVGTRLRYETIDQKLKTMDLRRTLEAMAQLAIRCEQGSAENHLKVARELDSRLAAQYERVIRLETESELLLASPQALQRLTIRALAFCPDSGGGEDLSGLAARLLGLTVSLQDLLAAQYTEDGLALEITRLHAYYHQPPFLESLEVTARMIDAHFARHPSPGSVDLEAIVAGGSGLSLSETLAISVMAGLNSSRSQANYRWPPAVGSDFGLTTEQLVSWAELWSATIDDARRRAKEEIDKSDWTVGTLVARPFIDFDENRFVPIRPTDVERLSSPVGMRALFERLAPTAGVKRQHVGPYWGILLDDAGKAIAEEAETATRTYLSEDAIRKKVGSTKEVCDGVFLEPNSCLCFDFTVSGLGVMALTDADQEDFWNDHETALGHKVSQLNSVVSRLTDVRTRPLISPLVVTGGVIPWTPFVASWIENIVERDAPFLASKPPGVLPIRVITVPGLRALIAASDRTGMEMAAIVRDWIDSDLGVNSLRFYLQRIGEKGPPYENARRLVRSVAGRRGAAPMHASPWEIDEG